MTVESLATDGEKQIAGCQRATVNREPRNRSRGIAPDQLSSDRRGYCSGGKH
jgi:hypothetical protein